MSDRSGGGVGILLFLLVMCTLHNCEATEQMQKRVEQLERAAPATQPAADPQPERSTD